MLPLRSDAIFLGTRGDVARRITGPGQMFVGLQCAKAQRMPTLDDLRIQSDDLRVKYEEVLRLRAELDRLQDRSKLSPPRKKPVPSKERFPGQAGPANIKVSRSSQPDRK